MNIYIGNLNYSVKESNLKQVLEHYGIVKYIRLIKDKDTGNSKGYAFAEMNDDEARTAISELNGSEFEGKTLVLKEALNKGSKRGSF